MKNNNKFYFIGVKLIQFSFFCFLFYLFVLWLGGFFPNKLTPNVLYNKRDVTASQRLLEAQNNNKSVDVLFIGSSHSSRGYDVRIFEENGYKSFNLGSSSQTPLQSELLLKKYFKKLKPSLVVFDVYPIMFTIDGAESGLDLVVNSKMDYDILYHLFKLNNIKVYNGFIYRYLSAFLGIDDYRSTEKGFKYIKGGFEEFKDLPYKRDPYLVKNKLRWNKVQIQSFFNIISFLQKENTPFYLFESPVSKELYNSYVNHLEFDSIMNVSKSNYINFNNKIHALKDTVYFIDKDHLNFKGVNIYNQYIIDSIFDVR